MSKSNCDLLARCFLRLANLPNFALDRLGLQRFSTKLVRFCLLLIPWIAASHKNEDVYIVLIMITQNLESEIVEFRAAERFYGALAKSHNPRIVNEPDYCRLRSL
jgi:hypothetical protein